MKTEDNMARLIKLAQPEIPEAALERAVEVLRSGSLVQGRHVQELEKAIADYLGANHAVVVSSGTAALHLALLASDIGPGDEVIVPAFTFPATANVVVLTGARPVAIDINLDDFAISSGLVEAAITTHTRAIMPVHEFGLPAAMRDIRDIAKRHRLIIVEDAACALGAEYDGSRIGAEKNLACFSFHPRKAITTGEGGVVVTGDSRIAERLRSLRNHGITTNRDGQLDITEAGPNYRMTDFQAALALEQLDALEEQVGYRQAVAGAYGSALSEVPGVIIPSNFHDRRHVYQTYHVLLDEAIDRNQIIQNMHRRGVESNFGAWALNLLTLYRTKYGLGDALYPNAVRAYRSGLALPIGGHVTIEDTHEIGRILSECLSEIALSV